MMSGEQESQITNKALESTSELWAKQLEAINQYLEQIGLSKILYNSEIEESLALTREEIQHMPDNERIAHAFVLMQYSAFLQKENNEHSAKLKWAEHNLKIMYGKEARKYGDKYTSYEERMDMVLGDNSFANALNKMVLAASMRVKSLEFMASKINAMAQILRGFGNDRQKQYS
jgi:hypothetical protein